MFWRSAKQPFPTLSTAESELLEAVEGLVVGDALDALVREHEWKKGEDYMKIILVDNQAATVLLSESSGASSWRTRHLRLRAQHLKWRVANTDWLVRHVPGSLMVADMGTKALPLQRLAELKALAGMTAGETRNESQTPAEVISRSSTSAGDVNHGGMMQLAVLMALIHQAKGQEERDDFLWNGFLVYALACTCALTGYGTFCLLSWLWGRIHRAEGEDVCGLSLSREESGMSLEASSSGHGALRRRPGGVALDPGDCHRSVGIEPGGDDAADLGPGVSRTSEAAAQTGEGRSQFVSFSGTDRRLVVTPKGECYHSTVKCSGLANADRLLQAPWCLECLEGYVRPGQLLYDLGAFTHVHGDVSCARRKARSRGVSVRHFRTLRACKMCVKPESSPEG